MLGVLCVKVGTLIAITGAYIGGHAGCIVCEGRYLGTLIAITGAYIGGHAGCIVCEGRYLDCNNGCLYRWACWVYCV